MELISHNVKTICLIAGPSLADIKSSDLSSHGQENSVCPLVPSTRHFQDILCDLWCWV